MTWWGVGLLGWVGRGVGIIINYRKADEIKYRIIHSFLPLTPSSFKKKRSLRCCSFFFFFSSSLLFSSSSVGQTREKRY